MRIAATAMNPLTFISSFVLFLARAMTSPFRTNTLPTGTSAASNACLAITRASCIHFLSSSDCSCTGTYRVMLPECPLVDEGFPINVLQTPVQNFIRVTASDAAVSVQYNRNRQAVYTHTIDEGDRFVRDMSRKLHLRLFPRPKDRQTLLPRHPSVHHADGGQCRRRPCLSSSCPVLS